MRNTRPLRSSERSPISLTQKPSTEDGVDEAGVVTEAPVLRGRPPAAGAIVDTTPDGDPLRCGTTGLTFQAVSCTIRPAAAICTIPG